MPNDYMPFKTIMAAASRFMKKDHTEAPGTSGNLNGNRVNFVHTNNASAHDNVVNELRRKLYQTEPNATSVNREFKKEEISKSPSGYTGIGQAVYDFFAAIGNVPAHIARFGSSLLHRSSNSKENHPKAHPAGLHDNNRPASIATEIPKTKTNHAELSVYVTSTLNGKNTFLRNNNPADYTTREQIKGFFAKDIKGFMDSLENILNTVEYKNDPYWFNDCMVNHFFGDQDIADKVASMPQELCNDFKFIRNIVEKLNENLYPKSELMKQAAANYLLTRGIGGALNDYVADKFETTGALPTKNETIMLKTVLLKGDDERLLEIFNKIADRGVVAA